MLSGLGLRRDARPQHARNQECGSSPEALASNECSDVCRRNPRECIAETASHRDGGIGERGGSREPVGGGNIKPNGIGRGGERNGNTTENGQQETEGGD